VRPFVCSWSGGKYSALALHRALDAGGEPVALLTMLTESGDRSRSHGLRLELLEAQAAALGIPLATRAASWHAYEEAFVAALGEIGAPAAVFGDIDVERNRAWVEQACARAGIEAHEPLWGAARRDLLDELLGLGFEAVVVAVRGGVLPRALLGRRLDQPLVAELEAHGVDASGELGEYHTAVLDGPRFVRRVETGAGKTVLRDGVWFLDVPLVYSAA
jgi:uncharacterized protein (TIGR00290 family)